VYHFELRKFPHTVSRFNQSEQHVQALAARWVTEEWIEVAERKWNVNEAKLTVLEGPELSLQEMAMNRGWRNAMRRSEDVTGRVLGAARAGGEGALGTQGNAGSASGDHPTTRGVPGAGLAPTAGGAPTTRTLPAASETRAPAQLGLLADSLGLEVLGALDAGPAPLVRVWHLAQTRLDGRSPSESLALADLAVRSLLGRGLVVLQRGNAGLPEAALDDVQSWTRDDSEAVAIARSG
jgi:hypothetical protein